MRLGRNAGVICAVLAFALAGAVRAQEAAGAAIRIAVSVDAVSPDAETVRRVVSSSVELYLEREGLTVVPFERRADASAPGDELSRGLADAAREADADFLMIGTTSLAGEQAEVDLRLYEVADRRLVARAQSTERAGLQLDRAIAHLTAVVLEQAQPALAGAARSAEATTDEPDERREPPDGAAPDLTTPGVPTEPEPASTPTRDRLVAIDARFVPFVPVNPAAEYMGFSYRGVSMTLLVLPFPGDLVGIGASVRGLLADAVGVATSAALRSLPLGLTVQLGPGHAPVSAYGRFTGGAAILEATNDILGVFTSIVPYAAAEIGVQADLLGPMALQAFVGFEALFEGSLPILGFSPGVGLTVGI